MQVITLKKEEEKLEEIVLRQVNMHSNYDVPSVPGVTFLPQWLGIQTAVSDSSASNVEFMKAAEASYCVLRL